MREFVCNSKFRKRTEYFWTIASVCVQVKCKQLEEESSEANIIFYKEELSKLKKTHAETERTLTLQVDTS